MKLLLNGVALQFESRTYQIRCVHLHLAGYAKMCPPMLHYSNAEQHLLMHLLLTCKHDHAADASAENLNQYCFCTVCYAFA